MYSIGQVEEITGISKDRLRNYEKNGILRPQKDESNNYRNYSDEDILEVLSVEYYRSMDMSIKSIKHIRSHGSLEYLKENLIEKEKEVASKIDELNRIHNYLEETIEACKLIEENLNKYSIKKMPRLKVFGEISNSSAFSEYTAFQNRTDKSLPIFRSMIRMIKFDNHGVIDNKMLLIEPIQEEEKDISEELCLYTIVKENVADVDVMPEVFKNTMDWINNNKYDHKGLAYIRMMLYSYPEAKATSYLEIFVPIKKA